MNSPHDSRDSFYKTIARSKWKCLRMENCNEQDSHYFQQLSAIQLQLQEALFTFDLVKKKKSDNRLHEQRNPRKCRLMDDGHPQHHRQISDAERIPALHSPGAASLSVGSISLRGKRNITLEILIHTNSRFTVVVQMYLQFRRMKDAFISY